MKKKDKIRADLCYNAKLPFTFNYDLTIALELYWKNLIKRNTMYYEPNILPIAVKLIDYKANYIINYDKKYKADINIKADPIFTHYLKLKYEVKGFLWVEDSQLHFKEGLVLDVNK
jgi:hypothetical protein